MHNSEQSYRLLSYRDSINEALYQSMEQDPKVFLFGLDVDDYKRIQGTTLGLVEKFGKNRVFGTPLSEDAMTGVGIGSALLGMRPIHVHIRMDFLLLAFNQLINMGAKMRYMSGGQISIPLVIRVMIGRSWGQGAQHSQALQSLLTNIPGLKVVIPSNAYDVKGLLIESIHDNNPVVFVEHRLLYDTTAYVPQSMYTIPFKKANLIQKGDHITLVSMSHMLVESLKASEFLKTQHIYCEVLDPRTTRPLDMESIYVSAQKTGKLLIVENGWLTCGIAAEMITQLLELCQKHRTPIPMIQRIGFQDTPTPTTQVLENIFYPSPQVIAKTIYTMVKNQSIDTDLLNSPLLKSKEVENFKGPF